jgi:hypothetical protein
VKKPKPSEVEDEVSVKPGDFLRMFASVLGGDAEVRPDPRPGRGGYEALVIDDAVVEVVFSCHSQTMSVDTTDGYVGQLQWRYYVKLPYVNHQLREEWVCRGMRDVTKIVERAVAAIRRRLPTLVILAAAETRARIVNDRFAELYACLIKAQDGDKSARHCRANRVHNNDPGGEQRVRVSVFPEVMIDLPVAAGDQRLIDVLVEAARDYRDDLAARLRITGFATHEEGP